MTPSFYHYTDILLYDVETINNPNQLFSIFNNLILTVTSSSTSTQ